MKAQLKQQRWSVVSYDNHFSRRGRDKGKIIIELLFSLSFKTEKEREKMRERENWCSIITITRI